MKIFNQSLETENRKEAQPDSILQANTPAQPAKICCKFIPAFEKFKYNKKSKYLD